MAASDPGLPLWTPTLWAGTVWEDGIWASSSTGVDPGLPVWTAAVWDTIWASGVWASPSTNTLLDDLVAHWDCDEAETNTRVESGGTTAYDLLESATSGGVGASSGKISNGADLDPANNEQLIMNAVESAFTPVGGFTCAGWVKVTTFASSDDVIGCTGTTPTAGSWVIRLVAGGGMLCRIIDSAGNPKDATYGGTALSTGTWYYVTAWYDPSGADVVGISIDRGTEYTTSTSGFTPQGPQEKLTASGTAAGTRLADVSIDEFAFWSTVKSDADLDAAYNSNSALAYASWTATASSTVPVLDEGMLVGGFQSLAGGLT